MNIVDWDEMGPGMFCLLMGTGYWSPVWMERRWRRKWRLKL
ncbi:MAG: hypothetical protein ACLU30_17700 [Odoribacter splanchnicus]